ncbi:MAG: hypothetical protein QNJ32_12915 [Xenococcaceae cyanobacterium MO_167.B27]|nr:hypothetical protein [Xenococcaceae cyanobacterium MO_167.B27]
MKILLKYTTLTTTLLFIFCLFNIVLSTEKVSAKPDKCEQIRQVRRLAFQENLDGQNLATLEALFCGRNRDNRPIYSEINLPPNNASKDCIDLTVMKRLAHMTTRNSNLVGMIKGQQQVTCKLSQQHSSFDWANGEQAKWGSTWYYPNGKNARWSSTWYYPNGEQAKWGSTWYYPNGKQAKWGSTWYYPNGNRASSNSLLGWACGVVGTKECISATERLNQTKGFWYELEIIELSWKAYQITQSR